MQGCYIISNNVAGVALGEVLIEVEEMNNCDVDCASTANGKYTIKINTDEEYIFPTG